jgi:glycosyltransferase involved in cell wall biosynthesis
MVRCLADIGAVEVAAEQAAKDHLNAHRRSPDPMRVLQLTKFFAPFRGGIESVVLELTTGLNQLGVATDVLCANHDRGSTLRESDAGGFKVTRVKSFGKLLSTSVAPAMVSELIRVADDYDVIHVHLPDPLTNLALFLARPKAKVVVHWHSDIVHQKLALSLYAPLQEWLLRRADAIIATSEPYWRDSPWLMKHGDKIRTIPIGIRDSFHGTASPRTSEVRARFPGKTVVFALGRMVYYKGFEHLVDAAKDLPDDFTIVIGGVGELRQSLQERISLANMTHKVLLVGNIEERELQAHFDAADVFCLPSTMRSEAFGVVLLEAMSAAKPIVATNIRGSGVPWVTLDGETGINVPVGDSAALAAAIRRIAEDPALAARLGVAARQRYLDFFTADRMVDATKSVYETLLS